MKIKKRRFLALCMALVLSTMSSTSVFAAEATPEAMANGETSVLDEMSEPTFVINVAGTDSETDEGIAVPYGSLSGYNCTWVAGNFTANKDNYFTVQVNGFGSPWAGCTLKTSGFSKSAEIKLRVCYGKEDNEKEKIGWKSFGSDTEFKNIAIWGVEPGLYYVYYQIEKNTTDGKIECWIY